MTSAKYISQSLFSSNSNPGYSGFALWRDRALRSPEIAIAHLSQGLRSSYHGREREVHLNFCLFNMPGNHDARLILKFGERLVLLSPLRALWQAQRTCNLPSNILSHDFICQRWTTVAPQQLCWREIFHPKCVYSFPTLIAFNGVRPYKQTYC